MKQYSRVSYAVRCQIAVLLKTPLSIPEIARTVGHHKSTIYRELKRNTGSAQYLPERAQRFARIRYRSCRRLTSIRGHVGVVVRKRLKQGWCPGAIAGRLRREKVARISQETIYRYTRRHPEHAVHLKFHKRRGYGRYRQIMARPHWMVTIRKRPKVVESRSRFGDWERDTMWVKNRGLILVCTERKSRLTKLAVLRSHKAQEVAAMTEKLLRQARGPILTVTNDNGGEFRWKDPLGYKCYYCEPHKPHQRGTVENVIGLLRRYIKRDSDPSTLNIKKIEERLNDRPRKCLDYRTPYEVFYKRKVALAV